MRYKAAYVFSRDNVLLKKIMGIALPNGVENGIHQLVKVALSSMVALFGLWLGISSDQFSRLIFSSIRFASGRWTQKKL